EVTLGEALLLEADGEVALRGAVVVSLERFFAEPSVRFGALNLEIGAEIVGCFLKCVGDAIELREWAALLALPRRWRHFYGLRLLWRRLRRRARGGDSDAGISHRSRRFRDR